MDSNKIMTSKEYTAWLEVSLASALNTVEHQEKVINKLIKDNHSLDLHLQTATEMLQRVYPLVTKDIRV